jgi:hypothetical protein
VGSARRLTTHLSPRLSHCQFIATGRGLCFDDVAEMSGISRQTLQAWHHNFTARFVAEHHAQWIRAPTDDELPHVLRVYAAKGMTGACGSVDCTHVPLGRGPIAHKNLNQGRDGKPSLVYEAVVGPDRFFHSFSLRGAHGAQNDKTTVQNDRYVLDIRGGFRYADKTFTLRDKHGKEIIVRGWFARRTPQCLGTA